MYYYLLCIIICYVLCIIIYYVLLFIIYYLSLLFVFHLSFSYLLFIIYYLLFIIICTAWAIDRILFWLDVQPCLSMRPAWSLVIIIYYHIYFYFTYFVKYSFKPFIWNIFLYFLYVTVHSMQIIKTIVNNKKITFEPIALSILFQNHVITFGWKC